MNMQVDVPTTSAPVTKTLTDAELVKRARTDDVKAFEQIMRRHNQRLYRLARSIVRDEHEAMDVVQETYVKAYYQLSQFRGPQGFASWLSRIASNEAMMRIRKAKRLDYSLDDPDSELAEPVSPRAQPMDALANQQLRKLLEEAIDSLSVDYRSVYVLRAIEQLSTRETAKSLHVSEEVVKTRFLRAKRSLQKVFASHLETAGLEVFEFAGQRCDRIVQSVMTRLQNK